jgi:hypothetical protein
MMYGNHERVIFLPLQLGMCCMRKSAVFRRRLSIDDESGWRWLLQHDLAPVFLISINRENLQLAITSATPDIH